MYEVNNMNNNQNLTVNPEEIKAAAVSMKIYIKDLKDAKKTADLAWEECDISMGEDFINMINDNKLENDKKFNDAISKLESRANSLDSISNIWKESELEILASYKQLNEVFDSVSKASSVFKGKIEKID